jgi:competence protein ComEC
LNNHALAESYFLDVGQGTSNIILLGQRRGIIIDCGISAREPLSLLRRYVDQIVALIVSHNDRDHHGGASAIVAAYPNAIDRVFFLQDRPVEQIALYRVVIRAIDEGRLTSEPVRLERDDSPRIVFEEPAKDLSLELLFPTFRDNLDAQFGARPNDSSAVLVLFCGKRKVVFPGDSALGDWRRIRDRLGRPIPADILAVPHHGGNVVERQGPRESAADYDSRVSRDLSWLYSEGVHCRFAVVSVGTSNTYGHPKPPVIASLRSCGAQVICTQITRQCHDNLEGLRPGVRRAAFPSQSKRNLDLTARGNSRNVACAGTVIAEIGPDLVNIHHLDEHQRGVDGVSKTIGGHPLCR